jgi:UDP-glucose 4-epimerase
MRSDSDILFSEYEAFALLNGDASRARALLGWKPTRSNLDTQIADAWRWMKSRELVGLRA